MALGLANNARKDIMEVKIVITTLRKTKIIALYKDVTDVTEYEELNFDELN